MHTGIPTSSPETSLRAASGVDAGRGQGSSPSQPRPAILPLRWRGHGVDVCAVIQNHQVTFVARDVLEAIGHDAGLFNDDPPHRGENWSQAQHATSATWDRSTVGDVLSAVADAPLVAEFLSWLDDQVKWIVVDWGVGTVEQFLRAPHVKATALHAADAEPAPEQPRWFSVSEAAATLSRDPAIKIGRDGLFEWMHARAWVSKTGGVWTPSKDLVNFGHLVVLDNKVPGQKDLYPQICITPVGLSALHRHLGGVADINPNPSNTPLLED